MRTVSPDALRESRSCSLSWLVVLGAVAVPQRAWANVGTPLIWAGMFHLFLGNALIGIGEGALLAWLFSVPKRKGVAMMVLANYASAWFGAVLIGGAIVRAIPMDLTNGWKWFWILVVATYGMTLVLEWPCIAWCFRGRPDWFRQSVKASFVLQSASYALVFAWYWMASGTSLYTEATIVEPSDLSLPESVLVYFIHPKDGNVYARSLSGTTERWVHDLHSTRANDRLFVRPSPPDMSTWELVARLESGDPRKPKFVVVQPSMEIQAAPAWRSTKRDPPEYEGTWFNFGDAQTLDGAIDGQWRFSAGFWPVEGLDASNESTGQRVRVSYETPFAAWAVRNAVHLPSDKALFQLGEDQICAFNPETRQVALLWHGRGAVPVIEKDAACPPGETVQWSADYCMAKIGTDDEIAASECIAEQSRITFNNACTAKLHFKRALCELLIASKTRPGTVDGCVDDPAFAGSTVRNGGIRAQPVETGS
jgi:hypothetical protein